MTKQANEMADALSYVLPYWPDSMEQIGDLEQWRGGRDVASKRALMAYLGQCGVTGMTAHVGGRPARCWGSTHHANPSGQWWD